MYRTATVILCVLTAIPALAREDVPIELEEDLVEWTSRYYVAEFTETFELGGEWIEYQADDGTYRFAATGDGDHTIDVVMLDDVESLELPANTEVFWIQDEDGEQTLLAIEYGSPVVTLETFKAWAGDPIENITSWSASACSKRTAGTWDWKCTVKKKKSCVVKADVSGANNESRKTSCNGSAKVTYDRFAKKLTFAD